jgi:hypothetical protein
MILMRDSGLREERVHIEKYAKNHLESSISQIYHTSVLRVLALSINHSVYSSRK